MGVDSLSSHLHFSILQNLFVSFNHPARTECKPRAKEKMLDHNTMDYN